MREIATNEQTNIVREKKTSTQVYKKDMGGTGTNETNAQATYKKNK